MKKHLGHTFFIFLILIYPVFGKGYHAINEKNSLCKDTIPQNKIALAPILSATGNQIYCPNSSIKIVTDFTITDPSNTVINAIYVQISSGYVNGQDLLTLTGSHPNINSSWNTTAGKLTLTGISSPPTYTELVAAIKDIEFSNSSANPSGSRTFSISIGQANYLPSNGHYYEFIPNLGITWSNAKIAAQNNFYYGLQGYLATITNTEEAQLAGQQASGAGWIGGSDEQQEGVWKWVTGPENGTIFWANGATVTFSYWNTGEPNSLGEEDYTHITAPGVGLLGSWNDISNTGDNSGDYQPKGYVVEYGGMPGDSALQISTSTTITIPTITSVTPQSRCGAGSLSLQATANVGIINWYDTNTGGIPLGSGNTFITPNLTTTTTYYVEVFTNECLNSIARIPVTAIINEIPVVSLISAPPVCEGASAVISASSSIGILYWYASSTSVNPIAIGNTFTTPLITQNTTYYFEAKNNGCLSSRIPVLVTVYPIPIANDEVLTVCEDENITLNAGVANMNYLWSTGETTQSIISNGLANYSVVINAPSTANCSKTKNFTLIEHTKPKIIDVLVDETTATILIEGVGNFLYSIDGVNYQSSNIFPISEGGLYFAYAKEEECGEDRKQFVAIAIPRFFTPNNDGVNDTWSIKGMRYYPKASVRIYNRFGQLITSLSASNWSWDGTLNGKKIPATDFWYVLKLNDTIPEKKGHFSIKR